ncbi:MAG: succinate dehydrogenase iron-sulfur subunit [Bacillota bacterium]|nr:succinate dehydrogenase iron-sulfur subunit [Bacillota bacterium]
MSRADKISLKIKRQEHPETSPYWEEFSIPWEPNMNVISMLMAIQLNPTNASEEKTTPVAWDCSCLEEVCGACTMIINGQVRQACSALVDNLNQPITLEPLTKFPIIGDLVVDRSIIFANLKKVKAWIDIDGTYDIGPGPRIAPEVQEWAYQLSRCMSCGCCMEACPNVNRKSSFFGPAVLTQVRLFNAHPNGAMKKKDRLQAIMGKGGISECGNAQNCARACPKELPLVQTIGQLNRDTTIHGIIRWFSK